MPVELLLLLLAWAVTVSLIVVLPWAVIRIAVGVLEGELSIPGADRDHVQPHQPPDAPTETALSHESDGPVEPDDAVPPPAPPEADVDSADK